MSVKMIGHSHLRHLEKNISSKDRRKLAKLSNYTSFAVSGLKTCHLLGRQKANFEMFASSFKSDDHVVLFIGDNDIDKSDSAEVTAWRILSFASSLRRKYSVASVTVHQLLPRYEGARGNIFEYNTKADKVNGIFKANCKEVGLYFLDSGFKFPGGDKNGSSKSYENKRANFRADGVHLSKMGYKKIIKTIGHVFRQCNKARQM